MLRSSPVLFAALAVAVAACNLTGPNALQPPSFGSVTALVRGKAWVGRADSDSVVLRYDSTTMRLVLGAYSEDTNGYYQGLALDVCKPLEARTYAFADTPNGPYGFDAMPLGVVGQWQEGAVLISRYMSHGGPSDAFTIEELDIPNSRVRGSFRFRAHSLSGGQVADIEGRFYGRLAFRSLRCSVQ